MTEYYENKREKTVVSTPHAMYAKEIKKNEKKLFELHSIESVNAFALRFSVN